MENPWNHLSETPPYVLPSDIEQVTAFNGRPRLPENKRLQLHVLPEPYIGRVDAPIVFLKLNPGYSPEDIRFTNDEYGRQVWRQNILHQSLDFPFYVLDPALEWAANAQWWRGRLRTILDRFDERLVANTVLCIEAFPYHSAERPGFPGILPSQRYSFSLVRQAIERNALILMANTVGWWMLDGSPTPSVRTSPYCDEPAKWLHLARILPRRVPAARAHSSARTRQTEPHTLDAVSSLRLDTTGSGRTLVFMIVWSYQMRVGSGRYGTGGRSVRLGRRNSHDRSTTNQQVRHRPEAGRRKAAALAQR